MRKRRNRKHPPGQPGVLHCATTGSIRAHQEGSMVRLQQRSQQGLSTSSTDDSPTQIVCISITFTFQLLLHFCVTVASGM